MDSTNHEYAIAFQDYVRTYSDTLFTEMMYGFKTSDLAQTYEGIKGEHIITQLEVGENLARRWGKNFDPVTDAATFKPRTLKTVLNKVDFSIVPQQYESSYLGAWRKKGQNPADWPFAAYVMEKIMGKLQTEFEVAIWQGVEEASPSAGDYLRQTFNGYLQIIKDALTAGDIDAVATGTSTASDIIADLRLMWAQVLSPYKENGIDILMSYALYDVYRIAYKDAYKVDPAYIQITEAGYKGITYELGDGNTRIIPINGLAGSNRIIMTPRENLTIGIDSPSDTMFRVKEDLRELQFAMDFRMGAQILLQKNGVLVVNDQE
jgi:hypothetical protein